MNVPTQVRSALLVAVVAFVAHSNIFSNTPVLDDGWVIFDNPLIKSLRHVPRIFREPYNVAGAANLAGVFRPLTTLSYALNYAAGGSNVFGYHLVNLLLHVACCLLVLALARRLAVVYSPELAEGTALGAALLFAVHPAHVEDVTAMVGRAELLAALGALGCLVLVCDGMRTHSLPRKIAATAVLALGVLSKENAATAPLLLVLISWCTPAALGLNAPIGLLRAERRRSMWQLVGVEATLALGVAVYPLLALSGPGLLGVPVSSRWFGSLSRSVINDTMTRVLAEYFRVLIWPHPLGVDFYYAHRIPYTYEFGWPSLLATLTWAAILLGALVLRRWRPLESLGLLWVFVALLPVLNIVPIGAMMAERFLYLPSVGFCIAVSSAGNALLNRISIPRWVAPALLGLVVTIAFALTWRRNAEWKSATTLWEAEKRKIPDDVVVNNNLAVEYTTHGDYEKARDCLETALKSTPNYWRAYVNLGNVQHKLKQDDASLASLAEARRLEPTATSPDLFTAMVYYDQHDLPQALPFFAAAASKGPNEAQVHYWYGRALYESDRFREAWAELKTASELDPGDIYSRNLRDLAAQKLASNTGP